MSSATPIDQSLGQRAYGNFDVDQALHVASREYAPSRPPEVAEVGERTWLISPGMSNVALLETDDGAVLVDCGSAGDGPALRDAVRSLTDQPLAAVVITHGHTDHAFGLWSLLEAGERPTVYGHANLPAHYRRYMRTAGLNAEINGQRPDSTGKRWPDEPGDFTWPDVTFRDTLELRVGGERLVLRHGKGETDDAVWVHVPGRGLVVGGDLVVGYLPNAGNPRKVQRYAEEWAEALREMAGLAPQRVVPGHGAALEDPDEIRDALVSAAELLEHIVAHTVDGLNAGLLPDHIVEDLALPERLRDHPWLQPLHDRAEFVCRNVIRRYGGWWDRYPANLLPATQEQRAAEIAALAGGVDALVSRARALLDTDLRLACHLAEWAFLADPQHDAAQQAYLDAFARRRDVEDSMMVKAALREPDRWVARARRGSPAPTRPTRA